jgi:hypothetical protein
MGPVLSLVGLMVVGVSIGGCALDVPEEPGVVMLYINEIMAANDSTIEDPDEAGAFEDWIEIYNASDVDVDMGSMFLTDDLTDSTKWRIPAGTVIPAGGYLLFWADGDSEQGDRHTDFRLDADGEEVGLFDTVANGNTAIDTVTFGQLAVDVSFGRASDGADSWITLGGPTPGQPNN